ncbi:hypothetical protein [Kiloniella laminariae]|uniref:hypothetical protein n=1 Tax=Kiloniella laminariae TaxID=454162 RepID=UPI0003647774|nr:hypothetical protein [Kiloniella laminariae]
MRTKNIIFFCGTIFSTIILASVSYALTFGDSNFGYNNYPSHSCNKPRTKPHKPYRITQQIEIDQYNQQVSRYNQEIEEYFNCIDSYVEAAKNDMDRIRDKANEAISEARRL